MKKLRIAVVLYGSVNRAYLTSLNYWVSSKNNVEVVAILLPNADQACVRQKQIKSDSPTNSDIAAKNQSWKVAVGLEKYVLKIIADRSRRLSVLNDTKTDEASLQSWPVFTYKVNEGLTASDAMALASLKVDILLTSGTTALHENLLQVSRLGALSIDLHRNHLNDATPPGFWESYSREPKTTFGVYSVSSLQRPEKLLLEGAFRTQFSYVLNRIYLEHNVRAQVQRILSHIADTGEIPETRKPRKQDIKYFSPPTPMQTSLYLCKLATRLGGKTARRLFQIRQKWGIEITQGGWRDVQKKHSKRYTAPRGIFWADPFLRQHHGKTYCFVEEYSYSIKRAHISVLEISQGRIEFLGIALQESFHLSFPFIFQFDGQMYMCPETSERHQIRLYRSTEFPLRWELCSIVMDKISAVDSMFFEHNGKWWLLTTVDRTSLNDHCSELCLFFADSPLDTRWTPHPLNPLFIDPLGGRNAGLIIESGKIFRAAQNQGFDQYGEGLSMHEITELSESKYVEVKVKDFALKNRSDTIGSHHISTTGSITVTDYLTRKFAP
jgi:hypothetical protein